MAGASSRFFEAGYDKPKYTLSLSGLSVFEHVMLSFEKYFETEEFLFVVRKDDAFFNTIHSYLENIGVKNYSVFELEKLTDGQAETAYLALKDYEEDFPITIFNIDTIRPNYVKPEFIGDCDGYLEVFIGEGSNWSFVESGENNQVIRTTEKEPISNLCSSGLYYFKSQKQFCAVFEEILTKKETTKGEYYIAPLYNSFIEKGLDIKYEIIPLNEILFCGTPDEYLTLKEEMEKNA